MGKEGDYIPWGYKSHSQTADEKGTVIILGGGTRFPVM